MVNQWEVMYFIFQKQHRVTQRKWRQNQSRISTIWPRGYKTFFILNSAEHEIVPAQKG